MPARRTPTPRTQPEPLQTIDRAESTVGFVFNPVRVTARLPFDLGFGCTLSAATTEQRRKIKAHLRSRAFSSNGGSPYLLYESDCVAVADAAPGTFRYEPLPPARWRYYIVTSPPRGYWNIELHLVSGITTTPLELIALHFHEPNAGWGHRALSAMKYNHPAGVETVELTDAGLASLSVLLGQWAKLEADLVDGKPRFPEIRRSINMYDAASLLDTHPDAQVIALFAILEMLITHNPELVDGGDSITRQLKRKIPLLARRFEVPLDFEAYFGDVSPDKVWGLLYSFRSAIAHGGTPDFDRKLSSLRSRANATAFIRGVIGALIRHAISEPQLVNDLKEV
jgi:hypothetical protein